MTMKQSPSRNQRSKGFKVKHVLHILLLLAICVWLIYQVRRSHEKRKAYDEESSSKDLGKLQSGSEFIRLGRRDLQPLVKDSSSVVEKNDGKEEEDEEVEEGRGGDEVDAREWEESEVTEDLIDEEDRDRDEANEDDKGIDFEDQSEIEEAKTDVREAIEDAVRDRQGISRSLRRVQVESLESSNDEVEKETEIRSSRNASSNFSDKTVSARLLPVNNTAPLDGTTLNLASNTSGSYSKLAIEERSEDPKATSSRSSDSDDAVSTVSQMTSQLSSGESKTEDESSKDEHSTDSPDLLLKSDMKKL